MRRKIRFAFLILFVMFGVCFSEMGVYNVQAEESTLTLTDKGDYFVAEYTNLEEVKTHLNNKTYPTKDKYVFAGWFKTDECTVGNAIRSADQVTTSCYAKFVDAEVLSVKCQISEGTTQGQATNIRFVSSVDSLVYKNIGFKLKGDTWISEKTNKNRTVYERIASATEGDEYEFSPKVVDTKSEYFITATWKGVTDFSEGFYVRAYWITLDGTTVYGESRYVSVNDGLNENIINMPVKTSELPTGTLRVTYGDSDTLASVTESTVDGDVYTHLKIDLGAGVSRKNLRSANIFKISDGTTTVNEVYRNLYTSYKGTTDTADTSWYEKYPNEDEFVIATSADLYGLSTISEITSDKTIYLCADIEANTGTATETAWTAPNEGDTSYPWTPISGFKGTFDGQGHTISGINCSGETYVGLFAKTTDSVTVQKLNVENSFFAATSTYVGTVVGCGTGTFREISSKAYIYDEAGYAGGLIGDTSNGTTLIENCWFAGQVTGTKTSGNEISGGFVGQVSQANVTINNCLYSGSVTTSTSDESYIGGFCGYVNDSTSTLGISNSLSLGEVNGTLNAIGSITGHTDNSVVVTLKNVYYAQNKCIKNDTTTTVGVGALNGDVNATLTGGIEGTEIDETAIVGFNTFDYVDALGFYSKSEWTTNHNNKKYWVARANSTPMLRSFATEDVIYTPDTTWQKVDGNDNTNLITTPEELYGMAKLSQKSGLGGQTFVLGADIEINAGEAKAWADEAPIYSWITIASTSQQFHGNFDGAGHTISGVYLNTSNSMAGLFAQSHGSISDLSLKNSYFNSTSTYTGSIVGFLAQGTVDTVYSDAFVNSTADDCGGIIGRMGSGNEATINNSCFDGTVTSSAQCCGGIVGFIDLGTKTISNCLNAGSVTNTCGDLAYTGGILGGATNYNVTSASIANCLNIGLVQAANNNAVGSILGRSRVGELFTISNTYTTDQVFWIKADGTLGDVNTASGGNGLGSYCLISGTSVACTVDKMKGFATFDNMDGLGFYSESESTTNHNNENYWVARANATPILRSFATTDIIYTPDTTWEKVDGNVTTNLITTPEELYGLAKMSQNQGLGGYTFVLGADIEINTGEAKAWTDEAPMYSWITIANDSQGFYGTFNGADHTISGVYLDTSQKYAGLFAQVYNSSGGSLSQFRLKNSYFNSTNSYLGSIVGYCNCDIDTVYSDAIVTTSNKICGGLIGGFGGNSETTISNSWFAGTLNSNYKSGTQNLGGIVGLVDRGTKQLTHCLNTGIIKCDSDITSGSLVVGGLVGSLTKASNATTVQLNINNCLDASAITVDHPYRVGSVLGNSDGTVELRHTYTINNITNLSETRSHTFGPLGNNISSQPHGSALVKQEKDIVGVKGYENTELDFYVKDINESGLWVARTGAVPALKSFIEEADWNKGLDLTTQRVFTEWYYYNPNENVNLYTISSGEELYGLAKVVNEKGVNFAGKTVEINENVEVIQLNKEYNTLPIGRVTAFAGTFEGNNKIIRGLYIKQNYMWIGLFGQTAVGSTIQNFRLEESHIESTYASTYTGMSSEIGSIVGKCGGDIKNVYSNATVVSAGNDIGGIAGRLNGGTGAEYTIENCWFDGTIESPCQRIGGIVGNFIVGTGTIQNCLFTGNINSTGTRWWADENHTTESVGARVGGILGIATNNPTIYIKQCLSAGIITDKVDGNCVGSVIGRAIAGISIPLSDVYATKTCYPMTIGSQEENTVSGRVIQTHENDRLVGYTDYLDYKADNTNTKKGLDYDNSWILRKTGVPALKSFVADADIYEYKDGDFGTFGNVVVSLNNAVDYGVGNYVITITGATKSAYDTYISSLSGYKKIANTDSTMDDDGVYNTICTSGDLRLDVTLINNKNTAYITVSTGQPLSANLTAPIDYSKINTDGYTRTATETANASTTFAMIALDAGGNCFVIQLPNGHFIINDGGFVSEFNKLMTYLESKVPTGKKPIIEAWTLSHLHADHAQVLRAFIDEETKAYADKIYVEGFYFSETSNDAKDKELDEYDNIEVLYAVVEQVTKAVGTLKTTMGAVPEVYRYQTGHRYCFNGVNMDVILGQEQMTLDDYTFPDYYNASSVTVMFTDVTSGKKILIGGDAIEENMNYIMAAYGTNSVTLAKINIFQALHHGKNTTKKYAQYLIDLNKGNKFDYVLFPRDEIFQSTTNFPNATEANNLLEKNATEYYTYKDGNVVIELKQ